MVYLFMHDKNLPCKIKGEKVRNGWQDSPSKKKKENNNVFTTMSPYWLKPHSMLPPNA